MSAAKCWVDRGFSRRLAGFGGLSVAFRLEPMVCLPETVLFLASLSVMSSRVSSWPRAKRVQVLVTDSCAPRTEYIHFGLPVCSVARLRSTERLKGRYRSINWLPVG